MKVLLFNLVILLSRAAVMDTIVISRHEIERKKARWSLLALCKNQKRQSPLLPQLLLSKHEKAVNPGDS